LAFPTTSVIENFTGSNGTAPPNANWTALYNNIQIQSNQGTGTGTSNIAAWDTSTFGPDCEAYVTITTINGSYYLYVRGTTLSVATVDGYLLLVNGSSWDIQEVLNAVGTSLSTGTQAVANGEGVGLEAIGTALKAYHYTSGAWNQTPIVSTSDGTYADAGYIMLGCGNTTIRMDDFGGGTVVAPKSYTASGVESFAGSIRRLINNLTRRYTGVVSSSGSYSRAINKLTRVYAGAVSSSASISRLINKLTRTYSSILSFAGTITKQPNRPKTYSGTLSLSGAYTRLINNLTRAYSSALSSAGSTAGVLAEGAQQFYTDTRAGALSLAGAISRLINRLTRTYAGVLSSSGSISRLINKLTRTYSGSIASSGSYTRLINNLTRAYSGVLSFSGVAVGIIKQYYTNTKSGVLSFAGTISGLKITEYGTRRLGFLSSQGLVTIIRVIKYLSNHTVSNFTLVGSVTGSYGVADLFAIFKDGVVNLTGAISRKFSISRGLSSAISFVGFTYNNISHRGYTISGALSSVGSIIEVVIISTYTIIKNRTVSLTGSLTKRFPLRTRTKSGVLSFTKYVTWQWNPWSGVERWRTFDGAISFAGSLGTLVYGWVKSASGTIVATGSYLRTIAVSTAKAGSISFYGYFTWTYHAAGVVLDEARTTLGTLVMSGVSSFMVPRVTPSGTLAMSGVVSYGEKTIEVLYYGPPNP
jgi:hypothetical protein